MKTADLVKFSVKSSLSPESEKKYRKVYLGLKFFAPAPQVSLSLKYNKKIFKEILTYMLMKITEPQKPNPESKSWYYDMQKYCNEMIIYKFEVWMDVRICKVNFNVKLTEYEIYNDYIRHGGEMKRKQFIQLFRDKVGMPQNMGHIPCHKNISFKEIEL